MKTNKTTPLKIMNRRAVLDALRGSGGAGAADLAAATGLSVATCAAIAEELTAAGMTLELEEKESTGGRPGRRYARNPERFFTAALAVEAPRGGAARIVHAVTDAEGIPVERGETKAPRALPEALDALLESLRARRPALRAAALSVQGVVRDGTVGICDTPELTGLALQRRVETRHGIPAVVENDVNFAALGRARTARDLAFLFFPEDNWPGAGLIANGAPLRGKSSFTGEISFLPITGNTRAAHNAAPLPHASPALAAKYIARIVACLTATLNPEVAVLAGGAVRPDMIPDIRRHCLSLLPAEHLPELEFCADFAESRLAGMTAAALELAYAREWED